eukprot:gene8392-6057_t
MQQQEAATLPLPTERPEKLPLQLPLIRDPRKLNRRELLKEIRERGFDAAGLNDEPKSLLVARLYALILEAGKRKPLEPEAMDDRQPEKWYLLAEKFYKRMFAEIADTNERVNAVREVNAILNNNFTVDELVAIGNGDFVPIRCQGNTALMLVCRFSSALSLEPWVESAASRQLGKSGWIRASVTISGNVNGYTGLPYHLTVKGALEEIAKQATLPQRKKRKITAKVKDEEGLGEVQVMVGEEVDVPFGPEDRRVKARVTGVEHCQDTGELRVVAVPTEAFELGPASTVTMSLSEYAACRGEVNNLEELTL